MSQSKQPYYLWLAPHPDKGPKTKCPQLLRSEDKPFNMDTMERQFKQTYPTLNNVEYYFKFQNDYTTLTSNIWEEIDQQSNDKENFTIYYHVRNQSQKISKSKLCEPMDYKTMIRLLAQQDDAPEFKHYIVTKQMMKDKNFDQLIEKYTKAGVTVTEGSTLIEGYCNQCMKAIASFTSVRKSAHSDTVANVNIKWANIWRHCKARHENRLEQWSQLQYDCSKTIKCAFLRQQLTKSSNNNKTTKKPDLTSDNASGVQKPPTLNVALTANIVYQPTTPYLDCQIGSSLTANLHATNSEQKELDDNTMQTQMFMTSSESDDDDDDDDDEDDSIEIINYQNCAVSKVKHEAEKMSTATKVNDYPAITTGASLVDNLRATATEKKEWDKVYNRYDKAANKGVDNKFKRKTKTKKNRKDKMKQQRKNSIEKVQAHKPPKKKRRKNKNIN